MPTPGSQKYVYCLWIFMKPQICMLEQEQTKFITWSRKQIDELSCYSITAYLGLFAVSVV